MNQLKELGLHGTQVSSVGLQELTALPKLQSLALSEGQVELKSLQAIKKLSRLLIYGRFSDAAFRRGEELRKALPGCSIGMHS